MKYKVGDKVKLRIYSEYMVLTKKIINRVPDRIVTVSDIIDNKVYYFKDPGIRCNDKGVECLIEKYVEPVPIADRFEILDL